MCNKACRMNKVNSKVNLMSKEKSNTTPSKLSADLGVSAEQTKIETKKEASSITEMQMSFMLMFVFSATLIVLAYYELISAKANAIGAGTNYSIEGLDAYRPFSIMADGALALSLSILVFWFLKAMLERRTPMSRTEQKLKVFFDGLKVIKPKLLGCYVTSFVQVMSVYVVLLSFVALYLSGFLGREYTGLMQPTLYTGALSQMACIMWSAIGLFVFITLFVSFQKGARNLSLLKSSAFFLFISSLYGFGDLFPYLQTVLGMGNEVVSEWKIYFNLLIVMFMLACLGPVYIVISKALSEKKNVVVVLIKDVVLPWALLALMMLVTREVFMSSKLPLSMSVAENHVEVTHEGQSFEFARDSIYIMDAKEGELNIRGKFLPGLTKPEEVRELLVERYLAEGVNTFWSVEKAFLKYHEGNEALFLEAQIKVLESRSSLLLKHKVPFGEVDVKALSGHDVFRYRFLNRVFDVMDFEKESLMLSHLKSKEYQAMADEYVATYLQNGNDDIIPAGITTVFKMLLLSGKVDVDFSYVKNDFFRKCLENTFLSIDKAEIAARYSEDEIVKGTQLFLEAIKK